LKKPRVATAGASVIPRDESNEVKKPKKQPSEILNLFTAIKKTPTLYERRAIEQNEKLIAEKRAQHQ